MTEARREPKQWLAEPRPDKAWKALPGLTQAERRQEQDTAAGSADARQVRLPGGRTATGSVALRRQATGRRVWAYLRFASGGGNTTERYIGQAAHATRAENLRDAWQQARDKGLLG